MVNTLDYTFIRIDDTSVGTKLELLKKLFTRHLDIFPTFPIPINGADGNLKSRRPHKRFKHFFTHNNPELPSSMSTVPLKFFAHKQGADETVQRPV